MIQSRLTIRQLDAADTAAYRDLRLHSLKSSPTAFGASFEEEVSRPELYFEQCLKNKNDHVLILGAFDQTTLVGLICFKRDESIKSRHKGEIYQLFVKENYRHHNFGAHLLTTTLSTAFKMFPDVEYIRIAAICSNLAASRLYEKVGFTQYGIEKKSLKFNESYFDVILLGIARNDFVKNIG